MTKEICPQAHVNSIRGVREHIGPQQANHHFEERDHEQPYTQDIEGGKPTVYEHFVDHDLEKNG